MLAQDHLAHGWERQDAECPPWRMGASQARGTGLCSRAFAAATPTFLKADNSFLSRHKRSIIRFSSSASPSRKPWPDHRPITTPLVNNGDRQAKANLFLVANWWQGSWLTLNPPRFLRTSVSSPLK